MADAPEQSACFANPDFAVICSFLQRYGEYLGLPDISTTQLLEDIEDSKGVSELLQQIHIFLMRRTCKNIHPDKWQKHLIKLCYEFSEVDAWEFERRGYRKLQVATKLRILKNLLERQFDCNSKFHEKISELEPEELRFLPIGRDKRGLVYWYLLDNDSNVQIYREEQDDMCAETWQIVCRDREELAGLVSTLESDKNSNPTPDEGSRAPTPCVQGIKQEKEENKENTQTVCKSEKLEMDQEIKTEDKEIKLESKQKLITDIKQDPAQESGDKYITEALETSDTSTEDNDKNTMVEQSSENADADMKQTENEKDDHNVKKSYNEETIHESTDSLSLDVDKDEHSDDETNVGEQTTVANKKKKQAKTKASKEKTPQRETNDQDEVETPRRSLRARKTVIKEKEAEKSEDDDIPLSKMKGKQAGKRDGSSEQRSSKNKKTTKNKKESKPKSKMKSRIKSRMKSPTAETSSDEKSEEELEQDSTDPCYVPRTRKKRRGQKAKGQSDETSDEEEEILNDDTPCCKCLKYNHPEWILLCDKCDSGYHTACLRPPLMLIPDGSWFCPICEHEMLIEKLQQAIGDVDVLLKKKERLKRREERLAFVGINLNNILPGRNTGPADSDEEIIRKKKKKHKEEHFVKRSCRQRKEISYRFEDFDEMIDEAIHDDVKAQPAPGINRGKDMSTITGAEEEEEEEEEEEDNEKPPPVGKKKSRRLTALDSDAEEQSDESEGYRASEDSVSDEDVKEDEMSYSAESDSDGWRPSWRRRRARAKPSRRSSRVKSRRHRGSDYEVDDFVVSNEYDSEEEKSKRRSTRAVTRKRIKYRDIVSSEEEEESTPDESESESEADSIESGEGRIRNKWNRNNKSKPKERKMGRKRKCVIESDSEDSAVVVSSRKKTKSKYQEDDSFSEAEDSDDSTPVRHSRRASAKKVDYKKILQSDDDDDDDDDEPEEEEEITSEVITSEVNGNKKLSVSNFIKSDSENDEELKKDEQMDNESKSDDVNQLNGQVQPDNKPNASFMIDNLLKDTKSSSAPTAEDDDDLDLADVTDLISYVTQDEGGLF